MHTLWIGMRSNAQRPKALHLPLPKRHGQDKEPRSERPSAAVRPNMLPDYLVDRLSAAAIFGE